MNWTEVEIYTSTEGIEPLTASLIAIGIPGFAVKDSKDFEEFLNDKTGKWDYIDDDLMGLKNCETTVTVYLPENTQGADMLISIKSELLRLKELDSEHEYGRLETSLKNVKEEDWANNWKQYFKPFTIGEKLAVKPSWEDYDHIENRKILEIDPASSFGTGQHHTTRLCLLLLEEYVSKNNKILDLGTGSGILSIAALLLGAKNAFAIDIEENSVKIAIENAGKNNMFSPDITVKQGNILDNEDLVSEIGAGYDIITANIVADVLIGMSPMFPKFLKDNGILIMSGIISERCAEVICAAESNGFKLLQICEKEGWNALAMSK